ncbi:ABC transporter permease, partial [Kitasatospora purpeofusca]|uniref:ABC transporter permease n=1 Tax=Kitasatospora purpeofusca TaxID=67352 RepID=UPI00364F8129
MGLTLVPAISGLGVTLAPPIDKMTTDNIKADYLISMANGGPLDQSALTALEKADGISALSPQVPSWFEVDGGGYSASGVTPGDVEQVFALKTVSGSLGSLKVGQVAVGSKTAKTHGWKTGDTIPVTFEDDKKGKITVGALYEENDFLSPFVIPKALADEHSTSTRPEIREIWIKADGGATDANEKSIVNALGDNPAMSVMDRQDIRDSFGGFINTALNIMYGLLAMALLIAVLGVVNTLAMSVFERQQEIGMLRAIGLDRGRVKRMIRLEAVVISLFGAVIGVGLGVFLGWAIGQTLSADIPGYALVIPWDRLGVFLLLACLVGVLASLWPARSAAKLNMLTAIKTE